MRIIVFDLDDTLYSYESFLKMGFENVFHIAGGVVSMKINGFKTI